ncbi:MAG: hypothetical protein PVG85_01250 [Deltaproteobacteria bacterium]
MHHVLGIALVENKAVSDTVEPVRVTIDHCRKCFMVSLLYLPDQGLVIEM